MKDKPYFYIPIMLMRDFVTEPKKCMTDAIIYGLYAPAKKLTFDSGYKSENHYLISQFLYAYNREREHIPQSIITKIDHFIERKMWEDNYNDFDFEGFNPDNEVDDFKQLFKEDATLEDEVLEFSRVRANIQYFDFEDYIYKSDITIADIITRGKVIENSIPLRHPKVMVNKHYIMGFREMKKAKERQLVKFAVVVGILSILGKRKGWMQTSKEHIFTRAFGYNTKKDMPATPPKMYTKYFTETISTNILNEVEKEWHVHAYRKTRMKGTFIARKEHVTRKRLVTEVTMKKNAYKILKAKDAEYEQEAIAELNRIINKPNIKPR